MSVHGSQPPKRTLEVIHVAVLECEQMPENIVRSHGNFTDIFDRWLQSGAKRLNARKTHRKHTVVEVSRWPVLDGIYPSDLTGIHAFIVTGSVCSSYDNLSWIRVLEEFIRDIYSNHPHIKFFGSCFGHQILAQALLGYHGVRVERSVYGWENGVHNVIHSSRFTSFFPTLRGQIMRYQFVHSDQVVAESLPRGWISIGSSDMCDIQGLYKPGRVLTYQGHPEFDKKILYHFMDMLGSSGSIDEEVYETSLRLIDQKTTSSLAAEVVVRFLED